MYMYMYTVTTTSHPNYNLPRSVQSSCELCFGGYCKFHYMYRKSSKHTISKQGHHLPWYAKQVFWSQNTKIVASALSLVGCGHVEGLAAIKAVASQRFVPLQINLGSTWENIHTGN